MIIKLTLKKIRQITIGLIIVIAVGYFGYTIGVNKRLSFPSVSEKGDLSLFWLVWDRLEKKYLDQGAINPKKMVEGAISGMVSALGDPYTVFLPAEENKINKDDLSGEFFGVGIQLGFKDGVLAVVSPMENTPAEVAGIKAGDLILKIKDEEKNIDLSTNDISLPEAVKIIRGKEGSIVSLTLAREGEEKPFDVDVKRAKIAVPATKISWQEKNGKRFAYIHLLQFTERMDKEWADWVGTIVPEIKKPDFGGVILDLRNNPGGFLEGAVFTASEFLKKGQTVVWQENYKGEKLKYLVEREGRLINVPLVVLVNEGSASASEILAGALQDYKRAKIVGVKTFGKGTVQEPEDLPGESGLHVTIARWLLPEGNSIDKNGIIPDFVIEGELNGEEDLILKKGLDILSST